jgi:hypothetical protein
MARPRAQRRRTQTEHNQTYATIVDLKKATLAYCRERVSEQVPLAESGVVDDLEREAHTLARKLVAFRERVIAAERKRIPNIAEVVFPGLPSLLAERRPGAAAIVRAAAVAEQFADTRVRGVTPRQAAIATARNPISNFLHPERPTPGPREIAMRSLLAGNWPSVSLSMTPIDVIEAETRAIRHALRPTE